ncbi:alkaline phosphatase family protein [Halogeometricum luteum]|uniref:Alkaline phosphatase family protein n=1 Tax=Halogeometricum luteum TaxID=2950537 RepID=A0ABU2G3H8_9EURY|nr:alkaline phosphatase family protein [Halogeometricum sp. S3BR5-2]MDS0295345.1 alkaline phosphatase family protein [Halogeometricum sp. S3BR5-2]
MSGQKTILIGLDGLGFSEIGSLMDSGELPVLSSLSESTGVDLKSTHPPWTPCAWPSMLTGKNPGKHGVFDFYTRDGYDKRLVNRNDVDSPYLHDVMAEEGLTPIIINFPVTHPAPSLGSGALVPGYLAREDTTFYPRGLREEYESEYGKYRIYPDYGKDDDVVSEYISVARNRRDMARFLDNQYEWDLLAVQFQVTDSIFHDLEDRGKINQILSKIDGFVGDIISLDDSASVYVASDHGMGDYDWTFYVNTWLSERGYCKTKEGSPQYFRQEKEGKLKGNSEPSMSLVGSLVDRTAYSLSTMGISPRRVHRLLDSVGLTRFIELILPEDALVAAQNEVVDHKESIAYQLYFNSLGIHLNVEGRDPAGAVPESDYEQVRSELISELSDIRDPEGKLVFDDVVSRESMYEGENITEAPDILLIPRDYRYDVSGSLLNKFRKYPHKNHKPNGILLSNRELDIQDEYTIYDVSQTIAAEIGIPIDSNSDGVVLRTFSDDIKSDCWDDLAGEYQELMADDDTTSVEDRLADLGYME